MVRYPQAQVMTQIEALARFRDHDPTYTDADELALFEFLDV